MMRWVAFFIVPVAAPLAAAQDVTTGTILNHVTVVNTRTGALSPNMAVVLGNSKIVTVAPASTVRASGRAQVIEATGKFVVPGYNDMHAHVVDNADAALTPWPMLIANGITGFRQMSGNPELLARGQRLRQEVAGSKVVAPEPLALVGRLFNLAPEGERAGITTPAAAVQEIQDQKRAGTDFIKAINVSREVFFATAEETKKQKLDLVGHLTYALSGTEASNAGMKAFEHLGAPGNILFDCSTDETAVRQGLIAASQARQPAGPPPTPQAIARIVERIVATPTFMTSPAEGAMIQRAVDTYSERRCRTFAKLLAKNGTWQPLTLIRLKTMDMPDAYQNDPNVKYMPAPLREVWRDVLGNFNRLPAPTRAALRQLYAYDLKMVKIFKQEGVKMVAGDDLGGGWIVTGFGLHQEFKEMLAAGLTPLEVLQTTTINAAEFLHRTDMGTVESGKNADLVLLDANPVANVANLDKMSAVVLKGRYFDRAALDKMMADVETAYQGGVK
jgi:hypothetical protein